MKVIGKDADGEYKALWEKRAKTALLNGEYIEESDRVEFEYMLQFDTYGELVVFIYKPRHKKPFILWTLWVDPVREKVDFEKSHFVYVKKP